MSVAGADWLSHAVRCQRGNLTVPTWRTCFLSSVFFSPARLFARFWSRGTKRLPAGRQSKSLRRLGRRLISPAMTWELTQRARRRVSHNLFESGARPIIKGDWTAPLNAFPAPSRYLKALHSGSLIHSFTHTETHQWVTAVMQGAACPVGSKTRHGHSKPVSVFGAFYTETHPSECHVNLTHEGGLNPFSRDRFYVI